MSPKRKKRKEHHSDEDKDWNTKKQKCIQSDGICIVHADCGTDKFVFLTVETKDAVETKFKEISLDRLAEDPDSVHRMENICQNFLSIFDDIEEGTHGYHRTCYQRFTSNMKRLKRRASTSDKTPTLKRSKRNSSSSSTGKVIFKPDCLFCNKEGKISVIKKRL